MFRQANINVESQLFKGNLQKLLVTTLVIKVYFLHKKLFIRCHYAAGPLFLSFLSTTWTNRETRSTPWYKLMTKVKLQKRIEQLVADTL